MNENLPHRIQDLIWLYDWLSQSEITKEEIGKTALKNLSTVIALKINQTVEKALAEETK